jgi:hypothetical protein
VNNDSVQGLSKSLTGRGSRNTLLRMGLDNHRPLFPRDLLLHENGSQIQRHVCVIKKIVPRRKKTRLSSDAIPKRQPSFVPSSARRCQFLVNRQAVVETGPTCAQFVSPSRRRQSRAGYTADVQSLIHMNDLLTIVTSRASRVVGLTNPNAL